MFTDGLLASFSRINSPHNSKVVDAVIAAIGTDKYEESLIQSKLNF